MQRSSDRPQPSGAPRRGVALWAILAATAAIQAAIVVLGWQHLR